jgi:hypothetical protein
VDDTGRDDRIADGEAQESKSGTVDDTGSDDWIADGEAHENMELLLLLPLSGSLSVMAGGVGEMVASNMFMSVIRAGLQVVTGVRDDAREMAGLGEGDKDSGDMRNKPVAR